MRRLIFLLVLIYWMAIPAGALEISPPEVPEHAADLMPETQNFGEGLLEILKDVLPLVRPDLAQACRTALALIASVMIVSLLDSASGNVKATINFAGAAVVSALLMQNTGSMVQLGSETVVQMSEYGKLLLPVMTTAMAAQGGISTSAALYAGTAVFNSFLTNLISKLLVPMVYLFLALAAANSAVGEDMLKRMRDTFKNTVSWCLKTILTVFTTYMSITGVVSGTTDAAALKATKVTISSVVPVVGGILSDASEAVLVSAGLAKSAAGIYGILAILAIFLEPFLKIGIHYLLLKGTASLCGIFGTKRMTDLITDFSGAMGLLLAMTGASCVLLLISTVCFMKGIA